jgi:hypothetical protein
LKQAMVPRKKRSGQKVKWDNSLPMAGKEQKIINSFIK